MGCLEKVYALAKKKRATIILAEAEDVRVVEAAKKIEQQKLAELILIGDEKRIGAIAKRKRISLKARILSYETFEKSEKLATELAILRRKKGMTLPEAIQLLKNDSKILRCDARQEAPCRWLRLWQHLPYCLGRSSQPCRSWARRRASPPVISYCDARRKERKRFSFLPTVVSTSRHQQNSLH
jgi:hypothetical protein